MEAFRLFALDPAGGVSVARAFQDESEAQATAAAMAGSGLYATVEIWAGCICLTRWRRRAAPADATARVG